MKKTLLALGLGVTLATAAFASQSSLQALNSEIERFLLPYQNESTVAKLVFENVLTDENNTLSFALNGLYRKTGSVNFLEVAVQNLSYEYNNGVDPTVNFKGAVGLDLTKVIPQDSINQLVPAIEQLAGEMVKDFTREYGDAVTASVEITDKTQDAAGNYVSIKARIAASIDFAKLPAEKAVDSILLKSGEATISLNVKEGVKLEGFVVNNVLYKGFQKDGKGMKQTLDALLARDPKELAEIESIFKGIERAATSIVNGGHMAVGM